MGPGGLGREENSLPVRAGFFRGGRKTREPGLGSCQGVVRRHAQTITRSELKNSSQVNTMDSILKSVSTIYDVATLPMYYLLQEPWKSLEGRRQGGHQISPDDPYSPWIRNHPVSHCRAMEHQSLASYLKAAFDLYSTRKCLGFREVVNQERVEENGNVIIKKQLAPTYTWYTYSEIDQRVDTIVRGLTEVGLEPGDLVVLFMETRIEWILVFIALNRMGVVVAALHNTLGKAGIIHAVNLVESKLIITSASLLPLIEGIASELTQLKTIIYAESPTVERGHHAENLTKTMKVVRLSDLEAYGEKNANAEVNVFHSAADDTALILFTSGSTGKPNGVICHNRGALTGIVTVQYATVEVMEVETYIAYLPLAHIFELFCELYIIGEGSSIGYSSPFSLMDTSMSLTPGCKGDLSVLKPTVMPAVPLILSRLQKGVTDKLNLKSDSYFAKFIQFAINYKQDWTQRGYSTPLLDRVLFKKISNVLGGRVKCIITGGAPLSAETQTFVDTVFCAKIIKAYGATETLAPVTNTSINERSYGHVGSPTVKMQVKLIAWPDGGYYPTDTLHSRGEIHAGGVEISKGYFRDEKLTRDVFYEENGQRWFKTGDIGEMSSDGFLKIIDRAKDIVKLANGEFICLGKIEAILSGNEYVEKVCCYAHPLGNGIIALVSPNKVALQKWAKHFGQKSFLNSKSLCSNAIIIEAVLTSLKQTAAEAELSKTETPKIVVLCTEEWSPANGFLSSTLKVRRKLIHAFYQSKLEKICTFGYSTDAELRAKN